ncbi:elongation factor P--(R)-beta-lysine ligase [Oceanospirillum sp.]|uniref:elongation factor P--(R)-beta-lysine ligase n=1 Tax=Oceanospirillum sp. TaxID=2021254 RepID=UPI003A90346A
MTQKQSFWKPSASIENLRLRADLLRHIRNFFEECGVLEVQTPVLGRAGSTDAYLSSMQSRCSGGGLNEPLDLYLQTSPEFHMKRLLAAGSGAIWQLSTSFRNGEYSERHNPEFAMLEWYQPGYDLHELMAEVQALISEVLEVERFSCQSYRSLFRQHLDVDPFTSELSQLQRLSHDKTGITAEDLDRDACCDLLMSGCIEPLLGRDEITFVIDYPASQAALAKVKTDDEGDQVAARFECYYQGIELANGYHELTDAKEQAKRFAADNEQRQALSLPTVTVDQYLIDALDSGIPECAGVALGFDRLLMLKAGAERLSDVISFSIDRA